MRILLFIIVCCCATSAVSAQDEPQTPSKSYCPTINLGDLQAMEKADPEVKNAKIISFGFDLGWIKSTPTDTVRTYNKCWLGMKEGNTIYEQKIIWNDRENTIAFATPNREQYDHLRSKVISKHGKINPETNETIGKMFKYKFAQTEMDGLIYMLLIVSLKQNL